MTLTITLNLPANIERELLATTPDLDSAATEALLVSLYRQRKLSLLELSKALDLDRFETENILAKHNVIEDLGAPEEYLDDARKLSELLARKR